jgi:hypothetical protein
MAAYHAALGDTAPMLTVVQITPRLRTDAEGTIDWLVRQYFNSDAFKPPPTGLAIEFLLYLAIPAGFEPATHGVENF